MLDPRAPRAPITTRLTPLGTTEDAALTQAPGEPRPADDPAHPTPASGDAVDDVAGEARWLTVRRHLPAGVIATAWPDRHARVVAIDDHPDRSTPTHVLHATCTSNQTVTDGAL